MSFSSRTAYIAVTASAYAIFASIWIVFSDRALVSIIDPEHLVRLATAKGLAFVGVTATLFAIAMHKLPVRHAPAAIAAKAADREKPWGVVVVFAFAAVVIGVIASLAYVVQLKAIEQHELQNLDTIARAHAARIGQWLNERRADISTFARAKLSEDDAVALMLGPDLKARENLLDKMQFYSRQFGFSLIALLDDGGRSVLSYPQTPINLNASEHAAVSAAGDQRSPTLVVDPNSTSGAKVQISFVLPLSYDDAHGSSAIAHLLFRIDAEQQLIPLLENSLRTTKTGETVLVSYSDDKLTHLIGLRDPNEATPPMPRRAALPTPLAQALSTGKETLTGLDDRGTSVLAAVRRVPGTNWAVIAKIDESEVASTYTRLALLTAVMIAATLLGCATLIGFLWQRRRLRSALAELDLRKYLTKIAEASPGVMISFRMTADGAISMPYASAKLHDLSGIDPTEIVDDASAIYRAIYAADLPAFRRAVITSARNLSLFHHELRVEHPQRGTIWVEARSMPERQPDGSTVWHGFVLDISDRKREEHQLRLAAIVFEAAHEGIVVCDNDARIVAVNPSFTSITGYFKHEVLGKTPKLLQSGRHGPEFYRDLWHAITESGHWRGEIWNRRKNGEIYPENLSISGIRSEDGTFTGYVATFSDVSQIKQSEQQLERLAHHDPLTGLPNRLLFRSRLEHAITRARRVAKQCALLFLDLDRFKTINDSLGHQVGDELLLKVADRIKSCIRDEDTVARIGGDEFTVLIEEVEDRMQITDCSRLLIEALARPFTLDNSREICTGASIGISVFPDDGESTDSLFKHADTAMYQAKRAGGGNYSFYSRLMSEAANARLELETNLRRALEHHEFVLHYQPLVQVDGLKTVGVEALIRWQGPGGGLVSPGLFIPVAEETGMIVPLGDWVLRTACRQMRYFLDARLGIDTVAVNLSPVQFSDPALLQRVATALRESNLAAHHLELELTESALIEGSDNVIERLRALKSLGVKLVIDDFGTGYSSFAYLKNFPIDKIKIDRSFVDDVAGDDASQHIVAAIIAMAKSLKLEVLAEGVETQDQFEFLRSQHCDTVQGFRFGKAMAEAELMARLRAGILPTSRAVAARRPPIRSAG